MLELQIVLFSKFTLILQRIFGELIAAEMGKM